MVLFKKSDATIVIQWSIYLQDFMVLLRHFAGEYNISDWETCMYMLGDKTACYADQVEQFLPILSCFSVVSRAASLPKSYCVRMVMLHLRKTRSLTQTKLMVVDLYISSLDNTWQRLNKYFSGYTITLKVVSSRTVGGFNHVYSPCYFYPRVCYVYITTVLLG